MLLGDSVTLMVDGGALVTAAGTVALGLGSGLIGGAKAFLAYMRGKDAAHAETIKEMVATLKENTTANVEMQAAVEKVHEKLRDLDDHINGCPARTLRTPLGSPPEKPRGG